MPHLISQERIIPFRRLLTFLLIKRILTPQRSASVHSCGLHIFLENKLSLLTIDIQPNKVYRKQTSNNLLFRFLIVEELFFALFVDIAQVDVVDLETETDTVGAVFGGLGLVAEVNAADIDVYVIEKFLDLVLDDTGLFLVLGLLL